MKIQNMCFLFQIRNIEHNTVNVLKIKIFSEPMKNKKDIFRHPLKNLFISKLIIGLIS